MTDNSKKTQPEMEFRNKVRQTQQRKLRARREGDQGVWFGLGMFGLVGWSVTIPALAAIAAGIWIDAHIESRYSWTLMLLVTGIGIGCLNAWFWISRERRSIESEFSGNGKQDADKGGNHAD